MKDTNVQGEGDHVAGRRYQRKTKEFVESGRVPENAERAKGAMSGDERESLERARLKSAGGPDAVTIFARLREDHDRQRTLIYLVEKTHGDSEGREELFARLAKELRAHAAAEEKVLYAELLEHDITRDRAGHSVMEHKEMEEILDELENKPMDSPGWLTRFKTLAHDVRHHLNEEEHEIFQLAGKALDDIRKHPMATEFEVAKAAYENAN